MHGSCVRQRKKKMWVKKLQTPRSVKKEGEEVFQVPEQRFPCSLWRRLWWCRLSPAVYGRSKWGRHSADYPHCSPWRRTCGSRLLVGTADHGGSVLAQSLLEGLHPLEFTRAGAVPELQPVGGPPLCSLWKTVGVGRIPRWGGGRAWRGRSVRDKVLWLSFTGLCSCMSICCKCLLRIYFNIKYSFATNIF